MRAEILEEIGLTKSEINVYLALLELGSSTTGKIVDKSRASSSKIYEILDKLMQKGLVSFIIKSGVKYFEAAPPERIMDYMKEKEESFNRQKEEMRKLLPELELKQKLAQYKSEATIFKGLKGGETAFKYMINSMKKDDEWVGFVVSFANQKYFDLLTKLHQLRAKKGLKARILINEKHKDEAKIREKIPYTDVRYIPDEFQTPAIINIAGNITLLNIMAEEVTVFMIENKDVADSFRNQFEKMWSQDVMVRKGVENIENTFDTMLDELKPGEEYYVLGASWMGFTDRAFDYFVNFHKRRQKKGVKAKFLFIAGTEGIIEKYKESYSKLAEVKYLPPNVYEGMQINIYKNKVLFFVWRKDEPIVFSVEDKTTHDTFKTYFDALWDQEIRTYRGYELFKKVWLETLEKDDVLYFIGAKGYYFDRRPEDAEEIVEVARKKGMIWKNVVDIGTKGHRVTQIEFAKTRYFKEKITAPGVIWICGERILMTNWTKEEPIVVVIDNKEIADSYRNYFEILWEMAKP